MNRERAVAAAVVATAGIIVATAILVSDVSRASGLPPVQLSKPFSGMRHLFQRYTHEDQQQKDQVELAGLIDPRGNAFMCAAMFES